MSPTSKLLPWQVLSSQLIHSTPWLEVIEDTCLVVDKTLVYTYALRVDEGPMIIAEDDNEKLWLVRQYRHPIRKIIWQFPAEGKYPNESWEAAAIRGLQEELSLSAQNWEDLGLFHPDPGGLQQKYHAYLASGLGRSMNTTRVDHIEEVEELETQSFSREEIDKMIDTGEICDNWTLSGLFLYDKYKRKSKR